METIYPLHFCHYHNADLYYLADKEDYDCINNIGKIKAIFPNIHFIPTNFFCSRISGIRDSNAICPTVHHLYSNRISVVCNMAALCLFTHRSANMFGIC